MIMGMGCLFFLLVAVILIGGIWFALTLTHDGQAPATGRSQTLTLDILKMRYAKGEISKEQFEGMRRDLGI